VYRKTVYPYWRYYRGYGMPNGEQTLIAQGKTETNEKGEYSFKVKLDVGDDLEHTRCMLVLSHTFYL